MNRDSYELARQRERFASAKAIGLLRGMLFFSMPEHHRTAAQEILDEWDAARKAQDASYEQEAGA